MENFKNEKAPEIVEEFKTQTRFPEDKAFKFKFQSRGYNSMSVIEASMEDP